MNYSYVSSGWKSEIWWRDPDDYVNKIPKEVAIMLRLNEAGSENVVRLRSWRGFWEKLMYRVCIWMTRSSRMSSQSSLFPGG